MDLNPIHPKDASRQEKIAEMIRVNQAGEYGAARIYDGQLAILKDKPCADIIRHMRCQEETHLKAFNQMMVERRVRPTILSPLWHVAGYILGAGTALLGEKAAMACTVAVEEVIDEHYHKQEQVLADDPCEQPLRSLIAQCRQDELAHRDTSLNHGATDVPGYPILSATIKAGARFAIWASKRI